MTEFNQTLANLKATMNHLQTNIAAATEEEKKLLFKQVEVTLDHIRNPDKQFDHRNLGEIHRMAALEADPTNFQGQRPVIGKRLPDDQIDPTDDQQNTITPENKSVDPIKDSEYIY